MSNAKDNFSVADLSAALNAGDRADLVNVLKNKLLREIQTQHDDLEAKFFEERAALEAKYQKFYQPLYTKRFEIVNGVIEETYFVISSWIWIIQIFHEVLFDESKKRKS
ncbi:hypothetical protein RDI58_007678 [Solanum bulbocastanum]|uniref:Uncharacterized protein n=1 Tax=Solanum bulbocastanum TaxID=147425 RepID=A0AAN8TUD3_SOLBU